MWVFELTAPGRHKRLGKMDYIGHSECQTRSTSPVSFTFHMCCEFSEKAPASCHLVTSNWVCVCNAIQMIQDQLSNHGFPLGYLIDRDSMEASLLSSNTWVNDHEKTRKWTVASYRTTNISVVRKSGREVSVTTCCIIGEGVDQNLTTELGTTAQGPANVQKTSWTRTQ